MLTAPQVDPTQGGDAFWNRGPRQRRKEVIHVDGPHRVGATRLRDVYADMLWIFVPIQEQGRKVRGHAQRVSAGHWWIVEQRAELQDKPDRTGSRMLNSVSTSRN